jgi:hypothetical protein
MRRSVTRCQWVRRLLLTGFVFLAACSAHQHQTHDASVVDSSDPFADPFFISPPEWDATILQQSEVLSQDETVEPEKPKTVLEHGGNVIFNTLFVGASLGKLALPLLGVGF